LLFTRALRLGVTEFSWPLPERVLDLFSEFRNLTNGLPVPCGYGLLGALVYFGLDPHEASEKEEIAKAIGANAWYGYYTPATASATLTQLPGCWSPWRP
jgi:hypothetical protein